MCGGSRGCTSGCRNQLVGVGLTPRYCSLEALMPRTGPSPRLVPYGADQIVYLVVDSFGAGDAAYRETEVERADFETIIADFLTGQFNDPVRVIAFNTLERWSDDVSAAIATEIQTRCDIEGASVPEHISDFVDRYSGPDAELAPRLGAPWAMLPAGSTEAGCLKRTDPREWQHPLKNRPQ